MHLSALNLIIATLFLLTSQLKVRLSPIQPVINAAARLIARIPKFHCVVVFSTQLHSLFPERENEIRRLSKRRSELAGERRRLLSQVDRLSEQTEVSELQAQFN